MGDIHKIIGIVAVSAFGVTGLWGLGAVVMRRKPSNGFWHLVALSQVIIGLQVVVGLVLWALPNTVLPETLHLVYGVLSAGAMLWAQFDARTRDVAPWKPFVWASLFAFGLSFRALQTGMGL